MSAQSFGLPLTRLRPAGIPLGTVALGLAGLSGGAGVALHSILLLALAIAVGIGWVMVFAPETLLALLAAEGTLKTLSPFTAIPVDLLTVSLGLVLAAAALCIYRQGLVRLPIAALPMVLLVALLFFAAMRTPESGGTYKAVYFAVVGLTLVLTPVILIRDTNGLARLCVAFAGVGIIVALAAKPGVGRNLPMTIPGGNEITAALYPAFGAIACLTCLAARSGRLRLLAFPVGAALIAAAVRAGSRGVLLALVAAAVVAIVLFCVTARRPLVTIAVLAVVILATGLVARNAIGPTALQRYNRLTTDPERVYLRDRALTQALAHPLGNGIGTFGTNLPELSPRPTVPYPHNVALEIFNESGVLALGTFVALMACAAGAALRAAKRQGWIVAAVALTFALVEAFASGSVNDDRLLWLSVGIAFASTQAIRSTSRDRA